MADYSPTQAMMSKMKTAKTNQLRSEQSPANQRLGNWFMQNLQALIYSLGQLWRKPLASLLTASVIGIALTLPVGFYALLSNADTVTRSWGGAIEITAFLQQDLAPASLETTDAAPATR